jgi:hypothetical protein
MSRSQPSLPIRNENVIVRTNRSAPTFLALEIVAWLSSVSQGVERAGPGGRSGPALGPADETSQLA